MENKISGLRFNSMENEAVIKYFWAYINFKHFKLSHKFTSWGSVQKDKKRKILNCYLFMHGIEFAVADQLLY